MEKKIFLQLIKVMVKGADPGNIEWDSRIYDSDPDQVYHLIARQKLQAFLYEAFTSYVESWQKMHEGDQTNYTALLGRVEKEARVQITTNYYLWHETARMIKLFNENGIKSVVLKGPVAGVLYPEPECRKSGDIDIWIPSADRSGSAKLHTLGADFDKASSLLEKLGYKENIGEDSNYHMGFTGSVGMEVELHGKLMREIDSHVTEDVIESFSRDASGHIGNIRVFDGFEVPGFTGAYHGVYLFLHMLHHFVGGGFGYRLLIDWTLYLKNENDPEQRQILLSYLIKMGLYTFAASLTRISVEKLGLDPENAQFFYKDKKMESFNAYKTLIDELFEAGEFGHDNGRMVLPKDASVFGLVTEFHLQMTRNYPDLSKYVVLWPALWIMTLVRFLRNNRVMHRASTLDVINKARSRSNIRHEVKLFEE